MSPEEEECKKDVDVSASVLSTHSKVSHALLVVSVCVKSRQLHLGHAAAHFSQSPTLLRNRPLC